MQNNTTKLAKTIQTGFNIFDGVCEITVAQYPLVLIDQYSGRKYIIKQTKAGKILMNKHIENQLEVTR